LNARPKSDNLREIIDLLHIAPDSAVFIDANPAGRTAMRQAFPDMRILGGNPYLLRRILLWAPETQMASLSEARRRLAASATEFAAAAAELVPRAGSGTLEAVVASAAPECTGTAFLVPEELSASPLALRRAAFIGSCMLDAWGLHVKNPSNCAVEFFLVNNLGEPPRPSPH